MLMLHDGCYEVPYKELATIEHPEATKRWSPIPHHTYVDVIRRNLAEMGYQIKNEQFGVDPEGIKFFGLMEVIGKDMPVLDEGTFNIGLRNCNNHAMSCQLSAGFRVFVCDNMSMSGDMLVRRRHNKHNGLELLEEDVFDAIQIMPHYYNRQANQFTAYQHTKLNEPEAALLAVECAREKVYSPSKVIRILDTFNHPSHEEFEAPSVYNFFQAVTESLKGTNPFELGPKTQKLHHLCDALVA